jgi:hypothetical protein
VVRRTCTDGTEIEPENDQQNERGPDEKKRSGLMNRRTVLRMTAGATAGVALPVESVGAIIPDSGPSGVLVSIRRQNGNPLAPEAARGLQRKANEKAQDQLGHRLKAGESEFLGGGRIYAFVHRIDGLGRPATYYGVVGETEGGPTESEIEHVHEGADRFEKTVKDSSARVYGRDVSSADAIVSTARAGDVSRDWGSPIAANHVEQVDKPYGVTYSRVDVYEYVDDVNDSYGYMCDNLLKTSPGAEEWNNDWKNDICHSELRWWEYDASDVALDQHIPNGDKSGDYTVNASMDYEGASVGVSYDPPKIKRKEMSSQTSDLQKLKFNVESQEGANSMNQYDIAGQVRADSPASSGDTLLHTEGRGQFFHQYTYDNHSMDHQIAFFK